MKCQLEDYPSGVERILKVNHDALFVILNIAKTLVESYVWPSTNLRHSEA